MNALQKIRSLHAEITNPKDGFAYADAWALVGRLLSRTPADQAQVAKVCEARDAQGLDEIISALENPAPKAQKAPLPEFPKDDLAAAMRAYRKRLKLMRLSDESRLGNRATTGGKKSSIDAIEPPSDFPSDIWKVLVERGQLIDTGGGFYAPNKAPDAPEPY